MSNEINESTKVLRDILIRYYKIQEQDLKAYEHALLNSQPVSEPVATVHCRNGEWFGYIPVKVLKEQRVQIGDKLYTHANQSTPVILKGIGKVNGDGWKDTTKIGQVVFVWGNEMPKPYKAGQYQRIGNESWTASTDQYDFIPATLDEIRELFHNDSVKGVNVTSLSENEKDAAIRMLIKELQSWNLTEGDPDANAAIQAGFKALNQAITNKG
jgi:hypothetical protein